MSDTLDTSYQCHPIETHATASIAGKPDVLTSKSILTLVVLLTKSLRATPPIVAQRMMRVHELVAPTAEYEAAASASKHSATIASARC